MNGYLFSFSATNVEGNYFTSSIDKKKTEAMDLH